MSNESTFTLHPYDHKFDARLAQMWNESDDQWPGTFTDGVPLTEQRVSEWMDEVAAIIKFIIVEDQTDKVVGYGDLWQEMKNPTSCYVALLNVHPNFQGRSLARRMLTQMVDWATENEYTRITLGTWSANLKAMPLYKKVGFFWIPDTDVYMENYIPIVRQFPAAQLFFAHHDWYRTYARELIQIEDKERHPHTGETKVYNLRWEVDNTFLHAVIDRIAQGITGLETETYAVFASATESEPAKGVPYRMRWTLQNKTDNPLDAIIIARADTGIELAHNQTIALAPGETKTIEAAFTVSLDAPQYDAENHDKIKPRITSTVILNGQTLELVTGLKYRTATEITLAPENLSVVPGREQEALLQLHNRMKTPLHGTVRLTPQPGIDFDWLRQEVEIPAEGYLGVPLRICAHKPGGFPLEAIFQFRHEETDVVTKPQTISLLALRPGDVQGMLTDGNIALENDFIRLNIKKDGGGASLWNKTLQHNIVIMREELGPPFIPWELVGKTYTAELTREDGRMIAQISARSDRFSGVRVTREISLGAGPTFWVRHHLINTSDKTHNFHVRFVLRSQNDPSTTITVPRKERTIHGNMAILTLADGDVPKMLEKFAETWIALTEGDQVIGVLMPDDLHKVEAEWGNVVLWSDRVELAPQTSVSTTPIHIHAGPGNWRTVQQAWTQANGQRPPNRASLPQPSHPVQFGFDSPVVVWGNHASATLSLSNLREYAHKGNLQLELPPTWESRKTKFSFDKLDNKTPLTQEITFTTEERTPSIRTGQLHFASQLFNRRKSFPLIMLGGSKNKTVKTEPVEQDGHTLWRIHNGRNAWMVAPDFHGGLTHWYEHKNGIAPQHFATSFPDEGEISWLKPFFGGIRPSLKPISKGSWPSPIHRERWDASPHKIVDARGLPWTGVRLTTVLESELLRGLRAELTYLTLGGANIIKVMYRLINDTSVYRPVEIDLLGFFQVDGNQKNGVLHSDSIHRKRTSISAWPQVGSWAAVENPDTGKAIAFVSGDPRHSVQFMDLGEPGGHLILQNKHRVPPQSDTTMTLYLALADNVAQARQYQALRDL